MKKFPENIAPFKRTPVFTERTMPDGIRKGHLSKYWAKIIILSGSLVYAIGGEKSNILSPGVDGIIEPDVIHSVNPQSESVEFYVEFYK